MTDNTEREAAARAMYDEWRARNPGSLTWETDADWRRDEFYRPADAILAAGFRLTTPRTVTTVEELEALSLPEGAVLALERAGNLFLFALNDTGEWWSVTSLGVELDPDWLVNGARVVYPFPTGPWEQVTE